MVLRLAVFAHQGGWDEMLYVAIPIVLFVLLLRLANRRADRQVSSATSEAGTPAPPADGEAGTEVPPDRPGRSDGAAPTGPRPDATGTGTGTGTARNDPA